MRNFPIHAEGTMDYYECGDFPFNFFFVYFLPKGDGVRAVDASSVARSISLWLNNMPTGKTANWVVRLMHGYTELAKKVCPRLRDLATAPAGGITQPRTNLFWPTLYALYRVMMKFVALIAFCLMLMLRPLPFLSIFSTAVGKSGG